MIAGPVLTAPVGTGPRFARYAAGPSSVASE